MYVNDNQCTKRYTYSFIQFTTDQFDDSVDLLIAHLQVTIQTIRSDNSFTYIACPIDTADSYHNLFLF